MGDKSSIEWTDATWNVFRGTVGKWACTRVSPGCDHCYAATMNKRWGGPDYAQPGQPLNDTLRLDEKALMQPFRWREPRMVFVHSMTDTFHPDVPDAWLDKLFAVMALSPRHTFQVLTKRPSRMEAYTRGEDVARRIGAYMSIGSLLGLSRSCDWGAVPAGRWLRDGVPWPLPNVWMGVSIEQDGYAWRAERLRQTPAAVRFISAEPLLAGLPSLDTSGIDWLIVGAESGGGARPMAMDWVRQLRDKCAASDTAFFFKQDAVNGHKVSTPELDGVRWTEFPTARAPVEA